jgi:hypothetical protein
MRDILFDEKIAGSFHFTPGQAYEDCGNGNKSQVHWDMVCIQRPEYGGGEIWFDGQADPQGRPLRSQGAPQAQSRLPAGSRLSLIVSTNTDSLMLMTKEPPGTLEAFIQALPKTETHLHIEGALPYDELLRTLDPVAYGPDPEFRRRSYRYPTFPDFEQTLLRHALPWYTSAERYHEAARVIFAGTWPRTSATSRRASTST